MEVVSKSGTAFLVPEHPWRRMVETRCLLRSRECARRLTESVARVQAGEFERHELISDVGNGSVVNVAFGKAGWEDHTFCVNEPKTLRRINRMIDEGLPDPGHGIGEPERLTGNLSGYGSRRITDEHRLAYTVRGETSSSFRFATTIEQGLRGPFGPGLCSSSRPTAGPP